MMNKNPIHLSSSYLIDFIESAGNYVIINSSGKNHRSIARYRIRDIQMEAIDSNLIRIHNRYIVNVTKVRELKKRGRSHYITMTHGHNELPVSLKYLSGVRDRLLNVIQSRDIIYTRNDPGYPF